MKREVRGNVIMEKGNLDNGQILKAKIRNTTQLWSGKSEKGPFGNVIWKMSKELIGKGQL